MLEEAPEIYLGEEPIEHHGDLAKQIAAGKKLGQAAQALATTADGSSVGIDVVVEGTGPPLSGVPPYQRMPPSFARTSQK